ncbi:AMP-binding protein [Pseudonocardia sp. RS010]|uniref:AMP-binding protein n=1 Tax=Pseudonocardia sp. RS010 TaxID=3385979 RepID=UPI00399FE1B1
MRTLTQPTDEEDGHGPEPGDDGARGGARPPPLFPVYALSSQLHVCVRFAATMTRIPRFEPGKALEVIERDRVTVFEGVPTMYVALLEHPDRHRRDLSSLRVGVSGGAPIPAEVLDAFEREFGVTVLEGYGLTETASTTTFTISADSDGFVFVVDRKKDLIIRGGYNVYPREVEDVLYTHPAVREAAVVGVPDRRLGQEVRAVVALRPGHRATDAELIEYVRERVASDTYPRSVEFRDSLPKGASDKILKRAL